MSVLALKIYTFEEFPQDYAKVQVNLGNAYWRLSYIRDKDANVGRSIVCYREALRVFTKENLPIYYIITSIALADSLFLKGDLQGALGVTNDMIPVAEKENHPKLEWYRQFYTSLKSQN